MKNILRIFLLIALFFIASKVLFSDFELSNTENQSTIAVNE